MVKFAGSFPVFSNTTSEVMAVPGSPLAAPEEVSSADQSSAIDMETVAVALREIAPENAAQDDVAMNEKLRWPAEGYWKSGVGPKLSPTIPYPVSPGRSSKVEAEDDDEVWTVAVQREFSMRLESAGVSCRKTSWSRLGYPVGRPYHWNMWIASKDFQIQQWLALGRYMAWH